MQHGPRAVRTELKLHLLNSAEYFKDAENTRLPRWKVVGDQADLNFSAAEFDDQLEDVIARIESGGERGVFRGGCGDPERYVAPGLFTLELGQCSQSLRHIILRVHSLEV